MKIMKRVCTVMVVFSLVISLFAVPGKVWAETTSSLVDEFVKRMYTVALGRDADVAGVANWVTVLNANTHDGAGIAKEFILGEEFMLRNLTDEQFVDTLYQTFFGREADAQGRALWLAVLASGQTREYVLSNFVNLDEFTLLCDSYGIERGVMLSDGTAVNPGIPQFVKRMYTIALGRTAENEGLYNNVLALVVKAVTAESAAKNFFTSQEYVMKGKSSAEYVTDLYSVFMNRAADAEGFAFWVACLDQYGMTREEALSKFAESEEFKMIAALYGLDTRVEVPFIKTVGDVDDATYNKAVKAFEGIVKKMYADGLVSQDAVCITLDNTKVEVDITFDNDDVDLKLSKDSSANIYTLAFDYNFTWLEGFGPMVNGKEPAPYNKELIIATLGMVSDEPQLLFDRIDLDCFSAASLSSEKWTEIGDCFIKSGEVVVDEYISYNITKEAMDSRDASCVLTGTTSSGATVECVIEYDSSLVAYELRDNGDMNWTVNGYELPSGIVTYMHAVDDTKIGPNGYPIIRTGCDSYETYKKNWIDKYIAAGDEDATIYEYSSHTVNGYTYYWFEGFFMTETDIGDPDIIYVQIGENEYIELYNVMFEERFEDFINSSFYIKEVNVK